MNSDQQRNDAELTELFNKAEKWVRPSSYSPEGVTSLSVQESQTMQLLLNYLLSANQEGLFTVVFRGEKKPNLERKLFRNKHHQSPDEFYSRLFCFGDKAAHYKVQRNTRVDRRYYKPAHIGDVSKEAFAFIFNQLNFMLTKTQKLEIEQFRQNNVEFTAFFLTKDNRNTFIEQIERVFDANKRQLVRDYYLFLLHTCRSLVSSSLLISTSKKRNIARSFSWLGGDGVMFMYLVPEPLYKYAVSQSSLDLLQELCDELGLPTYGSVLYPKQEEVAIKGALFPHFIIGLYDLKSGQFVVNPHIFNQSDNELSLVPTRGLTINQVDFDEFLRDTNYARGIELYRGGYFYDGTFG